MASESLKLAFVVTVGPVLASLWCINVPRWMNLIVASWLSGLDAGLEFYNSLAMNSIPARGTICLQSCHYDFASHNLT